MVGWMIAVRVILLIVVRVEGLVSSPEALGLLVCLISAC